MRGRRFKPESHTTTIAVRDSRAQLAMLLVGARSIDNFTAESLASQFRVPAKEVAERLERERERRARFV